MAMKGADGKPLRVIETIAADNYKKFGMYLLRDDNGAIVDLIEKDHIIKGAASVTEAILQKWLTSGAPTRTYQHLIECLRQSELGALAELIANTTGVVQGECRLYKYQKNIFNKNDNNVGLLRTVKKVWIQEEHSKQ